MILFLEDWSRYPTAIIDYETKNKTFVRQASVYRLMGVENHAFLLALINPRLQGVDPHDPNLTTDQQIEIAIECKINPWYFFREVARAPGMAGCPAVPLQANRANISLFWSFFNHVMYILIQPRQTGKSFSTDTLMTLLLNIMCEDTQVNLLTKDDTLRRVNIQRIKDIMSELPPYLQQRGRDDANNGEEITINSRRNKYLAHVPQSSKKAALKVGRGLSSPIFHCDEPPFQPNIGIALPAALAAGGAAIDRAKEAGAPYGTILTTTAGKRDDPDGKFVYLMLMDSALWTEKFYDASGPDELEQMIRRNSRAGALRVNGTFNHRQLGKDDVWLKQKLEEAIQSGEEANRDFFNMWTAGSQSNPLPIATLERITNSKADPLHIEISYPHGYVTRWYVEQKDLYHRMKNGRFILALDPSEAGGGDDIGLVMIDIETLEVICGGVYNETNLINFAEWICTILQTFENVTCIIENRSTGGMILDYLLLMLPSRGIDPFARLYNKVVHESDANPERFAEIKIPMGRRSQDIYVRYKRLFGFATSGSGVNSRSELYSTTLQNAAKRSCDKVKDKALVDQINGLITKNGRVDHEVGEHDDMVIAWLLCHWLLTLGKNLSFYGIDIRKVGSNMQEKIANASPLELQRMQEQKVIRQRIDQIYELLVNEQDEFLVIKLEQELRLLDKKIILEANDVWSVDEVIKIARDAKRNKRLKKNLNLATT